MGAIDHIIGQLFASVASEWPALAVVAVVAMRLEWRLGQCLERILTHLEGHHQERQ